MPDFGREAAACFLMLEQHAQDTQISNSSMSSFPPLEFLLLIPLAFSTRES